MRLQAIEGVWEMLRASDRADTRRPMPKLVGLLVCMLLVLCVAPRSVLGEEGQVTEMGEERLGADTTPVAKSDAQGSDFDAASPSASSREGTMGEDGVAVDEESQAAVATIAATDMGASSLDDADEPGLVAQSSSSNVRITGTAHVQNDGWVSGKNGADGSLVLGTTNRGLRLEALTLKAEGGAAAPAGVSCKVHVQNEGWKDWTAEGKPAGSFGKSQRLEAMRIKLEGANGWHVYYRVHVQNIGWMGWASDGELAGTAGMGLRMECIEVRLVADGQNAPQKGEAFRDEGITSSAHVQSIGWQSIVQGKRVMLGSTGRGLRVEALTLNRPSSDLSGDIVYEAHVQNIGWQGARRNGQIAGTTGRSLRVEAIRVSLTGELAETYDVWYRTHVGEVGWLAWTKNGEDSGSGGMSLRLEALEVALLPKGAQAPSAPGQVSTRAFYDGASESVTCSYAAQVNGERMKAQSNGAISGTVGQSKPMQAISASVSGMPGSVRYDVHVSNRGWIQGGSNGEWVGSANVEAVRMNLSGEISQYYDIWYRAHVAGVGWLGWARSGEVAGSTGIGYPMEAWQVVIRSKGAGAPGPTKDHAIDISYLSGQRLSEANARQRHVVNVARTTPSLGVGLCAGWVETVFARAGVGDFGGNACDLYNNYCHSSDLSQLKVGMIVTVSSHTRTANGRLYGHATIYVGDGMIRQSVGGSVSEMPIRDWIAYYNTTVPPRWGWIGNVPLA